MTSTPFNLNTGNSVYAKVIATNEKGDSEESEIGSGAYIITLPDNPKDLVEDLAQRTPTTLGLSWNAGDSNGGSTINDYRISMAE